MSMLGLNLIHVSKRGPRDSWMGFRQASNSHNARGAIQKNMGKWFTEIK